MMTKVKYEIKPFQPLSEHNKLSRMFMNSDKKQEKPPYLEDNLAYLCKHLGNFVGIVCQAYVGQKKKLWVRSYRFWKNLIIVSSKTVIMLD